MSTPRESDAYELGCIGVIVLFVVLVVLLFAVLITLFPGGR